MSKIKSSKCFRLLIALIVVFIVTIIIGVITGHIYANAFFYYCKGLIISFCTFMVLDIIRWAERTFSNENRNQSKKQDVGWTIAVLLFIGYFVWLRWYHFSLWQICLAVIVIGTGTKRIVYDIKSTHGLLRG